MPRNQQRVLFNGSAVAASLSYLQDRTSANLRQLASKPGNRLAYRHHLWSSFESKLGIDSFWQKTLEQIRWSRQLGKNIKSVEAFLKTKEQAEWLSEVLRYLPEGHIFNTTAYLIVGYDNIVFNEDVALNMAFRQFRVDPREAEYYLIHELAHAGYLKYHHMPDLAKMETMRDLSNTVRFLTHLEGMGVISALRLRTKEGGLLDNDYKILLNESERTKRVNAYFKVLAMLEEHPDKKLKEQDLQVFDKMSSRATRLWYITGCHMAQVIERSCGVKLLRELVKKGSEEFFESYFDIAHIKTL